jgi:hypothetical protein
MAARSTAAIVTYWIRPLFLTSDPRAMAILSPIIEVDLRAELEKLREVDPDGHANLTEHIVLEEDE